MGKIVSSVLEVGAAIAVLAIPGVGEVLEVGLVSLGVAGATAATIVTATALAVGLSGVESILTKTPNLSNALASNLAISTNAAENRKIVFGTTAAGCDLRFKETYGSKDDRLALVIALASHQISQFHTITLDSNVSWGGQGQGPSGKYADGIEEIWAVECGTGTNGHAIGSGDYWTAESTFTGCAYFQAVYKLDKTKVWADGLPSTIITLVDGCPVYDPRLDSTAGGSGAMRSTDQTTWSFNSGATQIGRNPALCLLTYLLGWRVNGKLMWGMGIPANRINVDGFILYANLCEEQIEEIDGSMGQRYTCDGIFSTSDSHETIINTICLCMGTSIMVDVDGWYGIIEGYDDTATTPVAFGPDDVISSGVWNPAPSLSDSFNIVSGRFADPTQGYVLTTWGSVEVDPLADGIERTNTVDFGCVKRSGACQRIAKQMVVREKYSGQFTVVFGPRGFLVSVGSLISLTLPQFGFDAKLFRVTAQEESIDLMFQMTLREESAEIYQWDANEEKPLPTSILTTTYDPVVAEEVFGLSVSARPVDGTDSVTTVFCDVFWTPPLSLRTESIEIQARAVGQTNWTTEVERFAEVDVGTYPFAIGVNGLGIEVQARYRMSNGAYGDWATTSLGSTPVSSVNQWTAIYDNGDGTKPADGATVGAPAGTFIGDRPVEVVLSDIDAANGNTMTIISQLPALVLPMLQDPIDQLSALNVQASGAAATAISGLAAATTTSLSTITARIEQVESTATSDNEARISDISTLQASINDTNASVQENATAIVGIDGTLNASWTLKVQTESDGTTVVGGMGIAISNGSVDVAFLTDSFRIYTDGGNHQVFYADDSGVTMPNVTIDTLKAGSVTIDGIAAGLTDLITFTSTDVMIGSDETTLIETSSFALGDTVSGNGMATITFLQDSLSTRDTFVRFRVYVDYGDGAGYVVKRDRTEGIQTASGNTYWAKSVSFPLLIASTNAVKIKVTGTGVQVNGGGVTSGSYARDIEIDVLKLAR